MKITVTGFITSIEAKVTEARDGKASKDVTDILLAQQGEQTQLKVRFNGNVAKDLKMYTEQTYTGRLIIYKTTAGVGSLLMV